MSATNQYVDIPAGSGGGVTSVNTLTGAVTFAAGTGITLTPVGNTVTIAATGGGGGVSSVTASSPLASSGGATPNISLTGIIPVANGGFGLSGALTSITTTGNIIALPVATNYIYHTPASPATLQGIANNGTAQRISYSVGSSAIKVTLENQSASATAANRLALPEGLSYVVSPGQTVIFIYNTTTSRWNLDTQSGVLERGNANTIVGRALAPLLTTAAANFIVGVSSATALTPGSNNTILGFQAGLGLTTGGNNTYIGNNVGGVNATGTFNHYIGTQIDTVGNVGNTAAIGNSITVQTSNTLLLGGTGNPMNVGINNNNPQYRLDVDGAINATQGYYVNGVNISGWSTTGNAGIAPGTNFLGTTDNQPLEIRTNNVFTATFTANGRFGVQAGPLATIHAGVSSEGIGGPPAALNFGGLGVTSTGYAFGSGNKNYSVYSGGVVSGVTVFSTSSSSYSFIEPATADFDITGLGVLSQDTASSGYDPAVDPTPSYQIWAIYGSLAQCLGPKSIALSSWPVASPNQDVFIQWTAPVGQNPSSYYICRNGTDFISISSSDAFYLDNNTGWAPGTSPGLPDIHYFVALNWPTAGATFYRVLNTTTGTFIDDTVPSLNVNDDSSWASGSTVSPTSAQLPGFKTDADTINIAASKTITNSTDPGATGDICWDSSYVYVCISANTWKRTPLSTW